MNTKIKICGIRRPEDVEILNQYPPDYAGFICSKPFWRYVDFETFRKLIFQLRGDIGRVGVFVNPTIKDIWDYANYLDMIQLHGEEDAECIEQIRENFSYDTQIWKAVRVRTPEDIQKADALPVDRLVLDSFSAVSHGGTGTLAPWNIIKENRPEHEFFLAGGISSQNLEDAVREIQPFGVDVSSSVETDKYKDINKIREIMQIIRN